MPINPRGGIDIDQILVDVLSGGLGSEKFATTDASTKPEGSAAMWIGGNVVASGIPIAVASGGIQFNGAPTVLINGTGISWDDILLINGTDEITVNGA